MPKILITGNGFDLFHNLPTKYQHFMSIMKTIEANDFTDKVSFEGLFGNDFKDDSPNDYKGINDDYDVQKLFFESSKLHEIKILLEANLWYMHFKNILEIDTWIDFEVEVENIINQVCVFKKFDSKSKVKRNELSDKDILFYDFVAFNLIARINDTAFKMNKKYINQRKSIIDIAKIFEDLSKSFEEFIVIFNRYLVDVVSVFYDAVINNEKNPFHLMSEIYTFNYTPTLERIYGVNNSNITYLHGKISDVNEVQNLVLGVSDISDDIKIEKAYDFTKYYQKIKKNSNNKFVEIPPKNQGYDEETIFYIVGHSLNESDKSYISRVFDFLKEDKYDKGKVCVFYYDNKDRDSKIRNLLSVVGEACISRLHQSKRLYFTELNIENLIIEFNKELYVHEICI